MLVVAAAFFMVPLLGAAVMLISFIGRTVLDIDHAAVRLPARNARSKILVGVGDAAVMLFAVFVFFGVGSGIAAQPELLDELLALLIGLKLLECLFLFVADDVDRRLRSATSCKASPVPCADGPAASFCLSVIGLATVLSFF